MAMKNRIKEFVDAKGLSVYRFQKETGISRTTAYALYNDASQYPAKNVMAAICRAYRVQPGDLLVFIPDEPTAEA